MNVLHALVLGIIQGITEFLPISSSGHLILIPSIFNWNLQNLVFDVALHFGTALAVIVYFAKDWIKMLNSLKSDVLICHPLFFFHLSKLRRRTRNLLTIITVSVPVGITGYFLQDIVEDLFRSPIFVALMLIIVSFVMLFAEKFSKNLDSKKESIGFKDALFISLSQIVALIPGTSRSGITISTGLFRGFRREEAARFSFLLATPVIIGAALVKSPDLLVMLSSNLSNTLIGTASSFLVGLISIKWLLGFLRKRSLLPFVIYRIGLAVFILLLGV